LLVFIFNNVWKKIIEPWWEERLYRDVEIEGTWIATYPDSTTGCEEIVEMKRNGHRVYGTIVGAK